VKQKLVHVGQGNDFLMSFSYIALILAISEVKMQHIVKVICIYIAL